MGESARNFWMVRAGEGGYLFEQFEKKSCVAFTQEAKYEAERSSIPVTLVDLDELATLVVEHYESFDASGRALLPLMRVYWPASRG